MDGHALPPGQHTTNSLVIPLGCEPSWGKEVGGQYKSAWTPRILTSNILIPALQGRPGEGTARHTREGLGLLHSPTCKLSVLLLWVDFC